MLPLAGEQLQGRSGSQSLVVLKLEIVWDEDCDDMVFLPPASAFMEQQEVLQRGIVALARAYPRLLLQPELQVGDRDRKNSMET